MPELTGPPIEVPYEVLAGLDAVRRVSVFNMFDVANVSGLAVALGYDATADWMLGNTDLYTAGIMRGFRTEESGPVTVYWGEVEEEEEAIDWDEVGLIEEEPGANLPSKEQPDAIEE
jgi:hypothetical protein